MNIEIKKSNNTNNKPVLNYKKVVKYGIPKETNKRTEVPVTVSKQHRGKNGRVYTRKERVYGGLSNANILALMEAGSPVNNIPSRVLLKAVKEKYNYKINQYFLNIMQALAAGNKTQADILMEELALRMQTWSQKFFVDADNGWAPNAPSTIKSKGSDKPLIDTGELRKSIRGIVVEDK